MDWRLLLKATLQTGALLAGCVLARIIIEHVSFH